MITTIDRLNPKHDYSKEDRYLIFYHNEKPTSIREIKADWFDLNCGEKVLWLLVRELGVDIHGRTRYRNIKYENIEQSVKVVTRNRK